MRKIFVLGVSLDDQIFENAWMLFFGLSKHFFKSTNQIRLEINQSAGGEFIGQWEEASQKPWVLRKKIQGGFLRRIRKMFGVFLPDFFKQIFTKPLVGVKFTSVDQDA